MAKAQGEFARKLRALEAVYEVKREGINNNPDLDEATKKKNNYLILIFNLTLTKNII